MKKFLVRWQYVKRQGPYETLAVGNSEEDARQNFLKGFPEKDLAHVEIDRVDVDTPKIEVRTETDNAA